MQSLLRGCVGLVAGAALLSFLQSPARAGAPDASGLASRDAVGRHIESAGEMLARQIYLYYEGCPVLSVTPPEAGRGEPQVALLETDETCLRTASASQSGADPGLHVHVWRDGVEPASGDQIESVVIEVSNLYPALEPTRPGAPPFWIPGLFGDPSGNLTIVARGGGAVGATAPGGGFGSGAPTGVFSRVTTGSEGSASGGGPGDVAPIPLPLSIVLLAAAISTLHVIRRGT